MPGHPSLPAPSSGLASCRSAGALQATPAVARALARILERGRATREEASAVMLSPLQDLDAIAAAAWTLARRGKGSTITFSPKVFIPLTRLCRDVCGYCTFRTDPAADPSLYMSPDAVLDVARAGERLGCTEALFTLGERPEQRYPEARAWLACRGHRSTLSYLREVCGLVLCETRLWPHLNPGTLSPTEMRGLREVSLSMGLMLESTSERLLDPGGAHEHAPSKHPRARLRVLETAGELRVPFTTGLLVGIGDSPQERVDAMFAIRESHDRWGQIQEVIIQNFRAKPRTPMSGRREPGAADVLRTAAVARLVLGAEANIQVPPNLTNPGFGAYLRAGINDWGGVSPLTIDFVNPEAPWPQLAALRAETAAMGLTLRPRLPLYPEYLLDRPEFVAPALRDRARAAMDAQGYAKGGVT